MSAATLASLLEQVDAMLEIVCPRKECGRKLANHTRKELETCALREGVAP